MRTPPEPGDGEARRAPSLLLGAVSVDIHLPDERFHQMKQAWWSRVTRQAPSESFPFCFWRNGGRPCQCQGGIPRLPVPEDPGHPGLVPGEPMGERCSSTWVWVWRPFPVGMHSDRCRIVTIRRHGVHTTACPIEEGRRGLCMYRDTHSLSFFLSLSLPHSNTPSSSAWRAGVICYN